MVAMATSLRTSKSAMSSSDSLTPKPTPRIKQCVASYHTTEVIAHCHRCKVSAISAFCQPTTQTPSISNCLVTMVHTMPVNSNFSPKIGCHSNVPQHLWAPTAHPSPQPKWHLDRFRCFCTNVRTLQRDAPFPLKIAPSHGGSGPPSNNSSMGPAPKSSTQPASQSVQPFLQGSLL